MFDTLSSKLQTVFRNLGSRGTISEKDLDEALRQVRLALLEADVHFKVVREFVAHVREKAEGADVTKSLTPAQTIIDIVRQELVEVLGSGQARLEHARTPPTTVLLVGLKGAGKTTTAAKLALHLRKEGQKPLMVSADPGRVAAAEQVQALGKQLNIATYVDAAERRPERICKQALEEAKRQAATVVIVDSMGYVQLEPEELKDLVELKRALDPDEVLLVADAMTGQEAVHAAEAFNAAVGLTGLILTKLDGDARGGAALSIRSVTGVPIKFVGTGEKTDALEAFYPDRFAGRILGMGDILTLIDKAKEEYTDEEAVSLAERMKKGSLTLEDFLDQLQRVQKMGPLSQVLSMVPGMSQLKAKMPNAEIDESHIKRIEAIIYSMTKEERRRPDIIDGSRRRRIAAGSGSTPSDINRLLKQYQEARKLMQMMASGRGQKLASLLRQ